MENSDCVHSTFKSYLITHKVYWCYWTIFSYLIKMGELVGKVLGILHIYKWAWSFETQKYSECDQNFHYQILAHFWWAGDIRTKILRWISEQNLRSKDQAQLSCLVLCSVSNAKQIDSLFAQWAKNGKNDAINYSFTQLLLNSNIDTIFYVLFNLFIQTIMFRNKCLKKYLFQ